MAESLAFFDRPREPRVGFELSVPPGPLGILATATITSRAPGTINDQSMLASTKPGSAAAREGEDGCGDAIGSPLTASALSRRNSSILLRIVLKSSAARGLVRTTMPRSVADNAGKSQRCAWRS